MPEDEKMIESFDFCSHSPSGSGICPTYSDGSTGCGQGAYVKRVFELDQFKRSWINLGFELELDVSDLNDAQKKLLCDFASGTYLKEVVKQEIEKVMESQVFKEAKNNA